MLSGAERSNQKEIRKYRRERERETERETEREREREINMYVCNGGVL